MAPASHYQKSGRICASSWKNLVHLVAVFTENHDFVPRKIDGLFFVRKMFWTQVARDVFCGRAV